MKKMGISQKERAPMRIIMFDIDTLRPDHLGCYGYLRDTSPAIDSVAADGLRFDNYYCPNAQIGRAHV